MLKDEIYTVLKYLCIIGIPALATCYMGLSKIWGLPYGTEVVETASCITTCLGALLCISTVKYNIDKKSDS